MPKNKGSRHAYDPTTQTTECSRLGAATRSTCANSLRATVARGVCRKSRPTTAATALRGAMTSAAPRRSGSSAAQSPPPQTARSRRTSVEDGGNGKEIPCEQTSRERRKRKRAETATALAMRTHLKSSHHSPDLSFCFSRLQFYTNQSIASCNW